MATSQSGLQSGIKVSPALVTAFNEASTSPTTRALKISIIDESLEPNGTLDRQTTAEADFQLLHEFLPSNEAAYAIYLLDDETYIFISYVPDTCAVRSKMLYASTRSTLISTLGLRTQRLASTIIATQKSDITFPKPNDGEISLGDLSIREKELVEIKAAEAEGAHGTSKRNIVSSGLGFPISEDAKVAIAGLLTGGDDLVQLCIEEETIELAASNDIAKGEEIRDIIFEDEPRFTFFRFVRDYKGVETSAILFIYTCPSHSNIKNRMIYASSRTFLLNEVESTLGVHVDKKIETSEVDELTIAFLKREIHGVEVEEKKAFARPRGPQKRNNLKVETSSAGVSADENE